MGDLPNRPWLVPGFEPANIEECIYAVMGAAAGVARGAHPDEAWRLANVLGERIRRRDFGVYPHALDYERQQEASRG